MYGNYKEMHPTFWNSLTLIANFGTKSPFDQKQNKTKQQQQKKKKKKKKKHHKVEILQFYVII